MNESTDKRRFQRTVIEQVTLVYCIEQQQKESTELSKKAEHLGISVKKLDRSFIYSSTDIQHEKRHWQRAAWQLLPPWTWLNRSFLSKTNLDRAWNRRGHHSNRPYTDLDPEGRTTHRSSYDRAPPETTYCRPRIHKVSYWSQRLVPLSTVHRSKVFFTSSIKVSLFFSFL